MIVKKVLVKNVISKTNLPGADYVANPYVGCSHACVYCYAEFMKRFTNHHEAWGSFVDVKINAHETIKNPKKYSGKTILFSSVTDPYQPLEAKYGMTRRILEALVPAQPVIGIITKSQLITRDIPLLKRFEDVEVGMSISTLNKDYAEKLEPYASPPKQRLEALKKVSEAGIRTYVFISPMWPGITDYKEIIRQAGFAGYYSFENLNLRPHNKSRILNFIKANKPEALPFYSENYDWDSLEEEIRTHCKELGKECRVYFHHGGFKKNQN